MRKLALASCLGLIVACRGAPPPLEKGSETPRAPAATTGAANAPAPATSAEPADSSDSEAVGDDQTVEDDLEEQPEFGPESLETRPHPLDGWSSAELESAVTTDLGRLGSISLGTPNAGLLLNGVQAAPTPYFKPVSPAGAYGTQETLDYLTAALKKVHSAFPGCQALSLGHISAERGGHLKPHISHQSGRDVDIGFFYRDGTEWYRRGTAANLDVERNWAFVRALVTETDVEMILVDHSIQELLRQRARAAGEDPAWVDSLFGARGQRAIVRHAPGHATHFHVRFFNPVAQETARRAYPHLVAHGRVPPVNDYQRYRAKKGDTLGKIAKRFGTSVLAIKQANGLKKSLIREKQVYLIPAKSGRVRPPAAPLSFPQRRLPPERSKAELSAAAAGGLSP